MHTCGTFPGRHRRDEFDCFFVFVVPPSVSINVSVCLVFKRGQHEIHMFIGSGVGEKLVSVVGAKVKF